MTELIVALDAPNSIDLAIDLINETSIRWFKIGPQRILDDSLDLQWLVKKSNIFLDLKLTDTQDTVRASVKNYANRGIAAVSIFTRAATEAATEAANNRIKIWQLVRLTDNDTYHEMPFRHLDAHGVICPGRFATIYNSNDIDIVVPGVRLLEHDGNGHVDLTKPSECQSKGITHAVVGRPIWQAADPIAMANRYLAALKQK